jgi:hypothetical protein
MSILHQSLAAPWTPYNIASALFVSYIIYLIGVAIHRLYFSRYAKFPGPKLAGLTYGYMFYYDVIAGKGEYIYKIKALHEEYGKHMLTSFECQNSPVVGSVAFSQIT